MDKAESESRDTIGREKDQLTVAEAGRRGGILTRDRYGRKFYQKIGAAGGKRTAELYANLLREWGEKGGRPRRPALDENLGEEHLERKEARLAPGCSPPSN